jgi:hypothetical protein
MKAPYVFANLPPVIPKHSEESDCKHSVSVLCQKSSDYVRFQGTRKHAIKGRVQSDSSPRFGMTVT